MAAEQPKKAMTAFFLYCEEKRPTIVKQLGAQASVRGMIIKTAAEQWKGLSADGKTPYEKKAAVGKAAYESALEKFKASGGEMVRKSKKVDKGGKAKKDKDAPKKPSGGGYGQYLSQHRAEIVKSLPAGSNPISDVAKAAGGRWKALSEADKKPYEEKFAEKMKEFRTAMEAYKASNPAADEQEEKEEKISAPKRAKADKSEAPPAKRAKKDEKTAVPKAKAEKAKLPPVPEIDAGILAEAKKLGCEAQLRNLASREDVKALGKKDKDLLAALSSSNGLVNPARRALLGA